MNCPFCGRILKEDSRFCDFCGVKVENETPQETEPKVLDTNLLFKWLLISVIITAAVFIIAKGAGLPIIFGGLFLPFFFKKKTQK